MKQRKCTRYCNRENVQDLRPMAMHTFQCIDLANKYYNL